MLKASTTKQLQQVFYSFTVTAFIVFIVMLSFNPSLVDFNGRIPAAAQIVAEEVWESGATVGILRFKGRERFLDKCNLIIIEKV